MPPCAAASVATTPRRDARLRTCVLLLAAELHAEVGLPDARALQLEVVRVLVTPLAPAALHLHPRHVHLGRALPRLVLELTLEEKACAARAMLFSGDSDAAARPRRHSEPPRRVHARGQRPSF
eukprot:6194275-Pleurochrysis_carterae.AAC.1